MSRLYNLIAESGAVAAAKQALASANWSDGLLELWGLEETPRSLEALVLGPEFCSLFTDEERAVAKARLDDCSPAPRAEGEAILPDFSIPLRLPATRIRSRVGAGKRCWKTLGTGWKRHYGKRWGEIYSGNWSHRPGHPLYRRSTCFSTGTAPSLPISSSPWPGRSRFRCETAGSRALPITSWKTAFGITQRTKSTRPCFPTAPPVVNT